MKPFAPLLVAVLLFGCAGEAPPDPSPTPSSPTAKPTSAPEPAPSPSQSQVSPQEAAKYQALRDKANVFLTNRDFEKALPLVEEATALYPDDQDNIYNLFLCLGWQETEPSKDSRAYPLAEKVLANEPTSKRSTRAQRYLVAAELEAPEKYGDNTRWNQAQFFYYGNETYALADSVRLHTQLGKKLKKAGHTDLWGAEASPKRYPNLTVIPKGEKVQIRSEASFYFSSTNWRKPLPKKIKTFDKTMYDVAAFYIEVVSGEHKGKKGWMLFHADRWLDRPGTDQWGVWLANKINLSQPYDLATGKPIPVPKPKTISMDDGKDFYTAQDPDSGLWGFKKRVRKAKKDPWVIQPQFRSADHHAFNEGLAQVLENSEKAPGFGYIDSTGAWAITPRFNEANIFRKGFAKVKLAGPLKRVRHEWKEAHQSGSVLYWDPSKKGRIEYVWVREDGDEGWIDKKGRFYPVAPEGWWDN